MQYCTVIVHCNNIGGSRMKNRTIELNRREYFQPYRTVIMCDYSK